MVMLEWVFDPHSIVKKMTAFRWHFSFLGCHHGPGLAVDQQAGTCHTKVLQGKRGIQFLGVLS